MSQAKKGGLGRGLAALIPTGPETAPGGLGTIPTAPTTVPNGTAANGTAAPARPAPARPVPTGTAKKVLGATPNGLGTAAADVIIGVDPAEVPAVSPLPENVDRNADGDLVLSGGAVYREIPPDQIEPNPKQPRQVFEDEALAELVHSIREFGLMQPIVVRRVEPGVDRFQIVMGERRWRAGQEAGLETIPSIVRETADDAMLRDALLENIHRVQLNPLEEAAAYQQLLEEFGVTHEELATRIGRSRPVVTNMIRLLKLPIPVQRRVAAG